MTRNRDTTSFYHYAQGRDWEASGNWRTALTHYQKTLSHMPHILGANTRFQNYLRGTSAPVDTNPEDTARAYAAMGRCYAALDMPENAILSHRAALAWHPITDCFKGLQAAETAAGQKSRQQVTNGHGDPPSMNVGDQLTIVMTTHFTDKLKTFKQLSPPSTRLVSTTYKSMLQTFGASISLCPKVLCYDLPENPSPASRQYEANLALFSDQYGFQLLTFDHVGLYAIIRHVMPQIKTPYVALIEHDWLFQEDPVPIADVLDLFSKQSNIHMIRFNKRENYITCWDYIMEYAYQVPQMPLLKTSAYSNNPCIMRSEQLLRVWLPLSVSETCFSKSDGKGTAIGMEEPLLKSYIRDVQQYGFSNAHQRWGIYIYGGVGDEAKIIHLGE